VNALHLFLPCAAGVEAWLADEVCRITGLPVSAVRSGRGGVQVQTSWRDALLLNLHSRLAQRVLVQVSHTPYDNEHQIYDAASAVAWEVWWTPRQTFKIDITAQHSPLKSLNFAALRVKDAICDRFRHKTGVRPDVDTHWPHVRVHAHLTEDRLSLYVDTSGEPLFKRGWREDKGAAPLKETLAAAMIAASGWDGTTPLYDPCCGSGTIAIEAAQIACRIAPGLRRRFGFENLLPYQAHVWEAIKHEAKSRIVTSEGLIFGSDVAHRMVDFAQRNAERAGVAQAVVFRGGDALQRQAPVAGPGVMLLNPPYGERIEAAGVAGQRWADDRAPQRGGGREAAVNDTGDDFFAQLARHWKQHFGGWSAWLLTPDLKLPGRMRLKETRRVPLWNGPIECRMFRFDLLPPKPRLPQVDASGASPAALAAPPVASPASITR
jgi:putative N6-adenine-specific DNA methylase